MLSAKILWYLNFCLKKKESLLRAYLQGNVMWMLTLFLLTALCIRIRKGNVNGKQFFKNCFPLLAFMRMIVSPPLEEFIRLHVYLMSGSDKMLILVPEE